jgi:hypothetical protein
MNIHSSLLNGRRPAQMKNSSETEGFLAWGCYRTRKIANFTREVHDFPNTTVSINVGTSAGWVEQLAGITNVTVGVASGSDITGRIGGSQIFGTGLFSEGTERIAFGQKAHWALGFVEGFESGLLAENPVYVNPESVRLFGNVQQITMVAPVYAATLAQLAVVLESSLSAQLRRLRKLEAGWDGDTAQRISEVTCDTAEEVIKQVLQITQSHLAIPTIRLGPLSDGTLRFECKHSNKELFLTISDKAVEIQAWQPLDAVESLGYWETGIAGAREHLEWLVK